MVFLTGRLSAVVVLGLLLLTVQVRADEQKVALKNVPQAVLDAIKDKFPKAELGKAAKETEDGKTIYKLTFIYKKHNYEAECEADGTFQAINKELEVKELPEKIAKVLEEKYPKARINLIEEITKKDKIVSYDVELVSADKQEIEVQISPEGTIEKETNKGK
jgi:hypothetical protein